MADEKPVVEERRVFVERRKGPDIVVKTVWVVSAVSWLLIMIALALSDWASPETETFFDRYLGKTVRTYWDENLLWYAFIVFLINFIICVIGFILNLQRQKRKTDRISKSIIVLGLASLCGVLWYLFR